MQHKLSTSSRELGRGKKNVRKSTNFFSWVRTINEFTMPASKGHFFLLLVAPIKWGTYGEKKKKQTMFACVSTYLICFIVKKKMFFLVYLFLNTCILPVPWVLSKMFYIKQNIIIMIIMIHEIMTNRLSWLIGISQFRFIRLHFCRRSRDGNGVGKKKNKNK